MHQTVLLLQSPKSNQEQASIRKKSVQEIERKGWREEGREERGRKGRIKKGSEGEGRIRELYRYMCAKVMMYITSSGMQ